MLSKMKMQTSQYRKSRIWEMKEDKYTSQESGLWNNPYGRCSQKRFPQICKALYGDAMLMSIWGAQIWSLETNKNIWFGVFLRMHEFIAWGIHKYDLTLHTVPYGFPCSNGQQYIYSSLAIQTAWTICSKKLSSVWTTWDIRSKKIVIPSKQLRLSVRKKLLTIRMTGGICSIISFSQVSIPKQFHRQPFTLFSRAQLFKGRLALNLELNLTRVSFSCVLKHFLG